MHTTNVSSIDQVSTLQRTFNTATTKSVDNFSDLISSSTIHKKAEVESIAAKKSFMADDQVTLSPDAIKLQQKASIEEEASKLYQEWQKEGVGLVKMPSTKKPIEDLLPESQALVKELQNELRNAPGKRSEEIVRNIDILRYFGDKTSLSTEPDIKNTMDVLGRSFQLMIGDIIKNPEKYPNISVQTTPTDPLPTLRQNAPVDEVKPTIDKVFSVTYSDVISETTESIQKKVFDTWFAQNNSQANSELR